MLAQESQQTIKQDLYFESYNCLGLNFRIKILINITRYLGQDNFSFYWPILGTFWIFNPLGI